MAKFTEYSQLKKLKHIFNGIIWTLVGLYFLLVVLLHLPPVQTFFGSEIATLLAQKFGTEVAVGSVNLGFFNRIIVDDVTMKDQQGDSMISAARISAKIDIVPLASGKISIASAQLFGLKVNLYKQDAASKPNFQFVVDSLVSKDTTKHTPLDLHIGSLIIRHANIRYNQRDVAEKTSVFSPKHIGIENLSSHIILEHIGNNDISLIVKKIAFCDKSGLQIKSLTFRLKADQQEASIKNFKLQLPHSEIKLGEISATYLMKEGRIDKSTLNFKGSIEPSTITLADASCFLPIFQKFHDPIYLNSHFSGTGVHLCIHDLSLHTGSKQAFLQMKGDLYDSDKGMRWHANIKNLSATGEGIKQIASNLGKNFNMPKEVLRLGDIRYQGILRGEKDLLACKGSIDTEVGKASLDMTKMGKNINAHVDTKGINLGRILENNKFGIIATNLDVKGNKDKLYAKGNISQFDYAKYSFKNISLEGNYDHGDIKGQAGINDPNIVFDIKGNYSIPKKSYALHAYIDKFWPSIVGMKMTDNKYRLTDITIDAKNEGKDSHFDLIAPFAQIYVDGQYDYATLYPSIAGLITSKLPTIPGIKKPSKLTHNNFSIQAEISSAEALNRIFGVPLTIDEPISLEGNLSDNSKELNLNVSLPHFSYNGTSFHGGLLSVATTNDTLLLGATIKQGALGCPGPQYKLKATAAHNTLGTTFDYNNFSKKLPIKGQLKAYTQFFQTENGIAALHTLIQPSELTIGDAKWNVNSSDITYNKNNLEISELSIAHDDQYINIKGKASPNPEDSIVANLKDVNIPYILDLVNFHSVEFGGKASGKAVLKSIFNTPQAYADLSVSEFTFENGPLGTLCANVSYDPSEKQINIDANADDGPLHQTKIDGYVSLKRNYIDLGIGTKGTSLKFMENFCGSFMSDIEAWCDGKLNVQGDLSNINLVGDIVANGKLHVKQLNTDYTFEHLRAHAVPDEISFLGDSIYDRNHNFALVNGGIHHKHLTRLSYDINLDAHNFLGYDTHGFGDNTFYGTVYATGNCKIHGVSGETEITIDATPDPGSVFVYNVASPDAINDKSFIHWHSITPAIADSSQSNKQPIKVAETEKVDIPSDMHINFLVNANPNLTMKLIMDEQTGDYITLQGDGVIHASYFNKGTFEMFGNYLIDHGLYKLTIQNFIKKDFKFMQGGTIAFGGNPYHAPINLKAKYTVNGVPLSDLSIGKSFSSNNIRVDCIMNITGTPSAPKVDFTMDLPTVNSDAKQMIYSVINSQEEMNQQVLYLLGIGRFYSQTKNNSSISTEDGLEQSQTSLAMQSFLSGTISQQINSVLSNLVKSKSWNFGANISTGDEGFYNAEYEGTLSGSLLNNRLLFDGQFGYRDNPNATESFIGDFDLRYLIYPNGNLSIHMYNQANDRYFTRNSMNTQGLGLIMKKDFKNLWDLFGIKKNSKKK